MRPHRDSGTPRTLEVVGAVMGCSPRTGARQVERDALAALRSPEIRARLEDLDCRVPLPFPYRPAKAPY